MICWVLTPQDQKYLLLCPYCGKGRMRGQHCLMRIRYSLLMWKLFYVFSFYVYLMKSTLEPEHQDRREAYTWLHNEGKLIDLRRYSVNQVSSICIHYFCFIYFRETFFYLQNDQKLQQLPSGLHRIWGLIFVHIKVWFMSSWGWYICPLFHCHMFCCFGALNISRTRRR